jgi:hypothetical protein
MRSSESFSLLLAFVVGFGFCYLAFGEPLGIGSVGSVILIREGAAKKSDVYKIGPYCSASWYGSGVDNILLRPNGIANDADLYYTWTLNRPAGGDAAIDRAWFDANCTNPVTDDE